MTLRPARPSELSLIRNSWFRSFRDNCPAIRPDIYSAGQNQLIERLLREHPPVVAALDAAPDEVVGWVCRSASNVHYAYVKHAFRRIGIGAMLVSGASRHSHQTRVGELMSRKHGSLYDPFLLMVPK